MEKVLMLKDIIGEDRTIIIACPECRNIISQFESKLTYLCPSGMLRRYYQLQKESIFYHINVDHCTQIVIAGHYGCRMVRKILKRHSQNISLPYFLEWKLEPLLQHQASTFLDDTLRDQIATELNVLEQIQILIDLPFVKSKLENGTVKISGIILEDAYSPIKEIYRNGVIYNDMIGSN